MGIYSSICVFSNHQHAAILSSEVLSTSDVKLRTGIKVNEL